ncbi:MAG: hypothetical protein ACOCVM_04720 [Desulfovibrionaceae bacterium]
MDLSLDNDDRALKQGVEKVLEDRKNHGLEGLVGDLEAVVVGVEPDRLQPAAQELLETTGMDFEEAFQDDQGAWAKLALPGSADYLVHARKTADNPFRPYNERPKSGHLPDTRLETFVFETPDLERYVAVQQGRGIRFAEPGIVEAEHCRYARTLPSRYTGNALGFIQWTGERGRYETTGAWPLKLELAKPGAAHLAEIGPLDHTATRVRAEERDAAILEFMDLTNHDFAFAIYVDFLNSITSVARREDGYAQVFTSGITSFTSLEESGPTERFIHNYGTRVHHMAFRTTDIEKTVDALKAGGLGFLSDLLGSPEEGLKQAFSEMSPNTLLVNEYIHRYGDFDGFFTRSNVTELTRATEKQ